ncbi:tyrosine-type recombinase/integrase [Alienimonas californiensis]|uniref:Core-binding (CB) domain-containing protein n=1 Tax=Alienimonas californiensis TaxID=2527989 RepID=A0A517P6S7_9PLAN|nr:hypothetical protein [Alienimonas californiensis]QDT15087.1 hypothetical protein CA12_11670 [Alienimonas californiensis]
MASLTEDPGGRRRIQFVDRDGRRRAVRLGKVSKKTAEQVRGMIERLAAAQLAGHAPDDHTARWVAGLGDVLHGRLAAVGLVARRRHATVGDFAREYVASRTDVSPATRNHLARAAADLAAVLGDRTPLRDVTPAHADEYRRTQLARGVAENTVRRRVGRAKQIFAAAVRGRLLDRNPFEGQKCQVTGNPDKFHFVTREEAEALIAACPNAPWRAVVALARFGGLRCPSELRPLQWRHVDVDAGRLTVISSKTAHQGKGMRVTPLFPELRLHLSALRQEAGDPAPDDSVLSGFEGTSWALGGPLAAIARRADLKLWPKPFCNMRATRQTELTAEFPSHVVCGWIGNSEDVANEHYLRTIDVDFQRAVAGDGKAPNKPR